MPAANRETSSPSRNSLPARTHNLSHQSSSVPSTPHQHARNRIANSRSPSPVGRLGSYSPQSVTSEANRILSAYPKSDTGPGCKYEGSLVPRRRFIYTNGGDSILEPPKELPKLALEPHEEDKLSGDMRELYDRLLPDDDSIRRRSKLVEKLETLLNGKWPGKDIKVHVFGSSGNMLCSSDSDVDICITTSMKELEKVCMLAEVLARNGMQKVVCVSSAKVPIVKIWDPELKLACDLNVNNADALENTRMIKTYVQTDDRVRPLAMIIKYWTSRRIINDAALRGYGQANKETLGQLLFQFFRQHGYGIDYEKSVISVRKGRLLTREDKGWAMERRLCVEEPFNTYRNLGNSADDYSFHGIHEEMRRAFDLLADGLKLDQCLEQYEFPPMEKVTFKKPEPKPKPILSRSHSQTRRSVTTNGPGNLSFKGKQQPNQRNGPAGRRSSSGAAFGQPRYPYAPSPPIGVHGNDYFEPATLHQQLFQQYQILNYQENLLKAHMAQTQGQPIQGHAPGGHILTSPSQRSVTSNPTPPRRGTVGENLRHDALLPGLLYHFPSNYPRSQIPPQAPQHDSSGTSTNPSSPSLMATVPALNRVHRSSVNDGSAAASVRSQSQPGRSTPNPLAMHAYAHPGFDVSGAIGHPMARPLPGFLPPAANGAAGRYAQVPTLSGLPVDRSLAKEYVGYYVGESPQLIPQYSHASVAAIPPYTDIPTRRRRVSPDLAPPGRLSRASRSPSPLGRPRTYSNGLRSAPLPGYIPPRQESSAVIEPSQHELPPIVNGSFPVTPLTSNTHSLDIRDSGPPTASTRNSNYHPKMPEFGDFGHLPDEVSRPDPTSSSQASHQENLSASDCRELYDRSVPDKRSKHTGNIGQPFPSVSEQAQQGSLESSGLGISKMINAEPDPSASQVDIRQPHDLEDGRTSKTILDHGTDFHSVPVPQLSPVFETMSPSPIISRRLDSSSGLGVASTKSTVNGSLKEKKVSSQQESGNAHERNVSQPNFNGAIAPIVPPIKPSTATNGHANGWQQQKSKKGGRRRANSNEERGRMPPGGEPPPPNEAERKGG
ncbi:MAG: hypothetical protein Q9165_000424 [Trypethelium subeluteriae]